MDDLELRVAALEIAFIEVAAWLDETALEDGAAAIRAGLKNAMTKDERIARMGALELIEVARRRYGLAMASFTVRPLS